MQFRSKNCRKGLFFSFSNEKALEAKTLNQINLPRGSDTGISKIDEKFGYVVDGYIIWLR